MFHRIKEKLGTAGFIIAIVALIAATAGGAYAAQQSLNGKQKKEVKKIAKKFAGKNGKNGKNGAPGAPGAIGPVGATGATGLPGGQGPQGDQGPKGDQGTPGTNGSDGSDGSDGKNVEVGTAGGECADGGATVQVQGEPGTKEAICNGAEGSPWTAGGTLPSGKTQTGTWTLGSVSAGAVPAPGKVLSVAISFPIPLAAPLPSSSAHYIMPNGKEAVYVLDAEEEGFELEEKTSTACLGSAEAPSAVAGHLCLYTAFQEPAQAQVFPGEPSKLVISGTDVKKAGSPSAGGVSTAGARLAVGAVANTHLWGTWAVTAPTP